MNLTKKKRILAVEDEKDFQDMLNSIFKKKFDIHFCFNADEFLKKFISRVWDAMIVDVDLTGSPELGHIVVRKAMELRNVYPRTIIISGKKMVNLEKIEKEQKTFFQAYIWKDDPEFRGKIKAEIEEAVFLGNKELERLEEIFRDRGKIDEVIPESVFHTFNQFGLFDIGFAETETIGSLIEACKNDKEDKEKIKTIMSILRKTMKQHNLERYEGNNNK